MKRNGPRIGHRRTASWLGVLLATMLLTACAVAGTERVAGPTTPSDDGVGLEHIHGLGIDPADGVLYAASHTGVYRLATSGTPVRVADRYQDTMGFLVVGPGRFLGSGHPDLREDLPSRLGLIESSDAGVSWHSRSLSGVADFHALRAAAGRVYGFDSVSSQLQVTSDLVTWQLLAQLPLIDFVISDADPTQLLATSAAGLLRSRNGGRTFTTEPGTPPLQLLSWPALDQLYGMTATGELWMSPDGGVTWAWTARLPGPPEALYASSAEQLYVATDRGIYQSATAGATFTLLYDLN